MSKYVPVEDAQKVLDETIGLTSTMVILKLRRLVASAIELPTPVSEETKADMRGWLVSRLHDYQALDETKMTCSTCHAAADEIVTRILNWPRKEGG